MGETNYKSEESNSRKDVLWDLFDDDFGSRRSHSQSKGFGSYLIQS
jgi:hypothetical protein